MNNNDFMMLSGRAGRSLFKIIVLTIIISWAMYGQLFAQFSGGKGSRLKPYLISTVEELDLVREYPTKHFRLVNDIDLSDIKWRPIGDSNSPFRGVFDGNGRKIIGLYIDSEDDNAGLFGVVRGGRIKSLLLTELYISGAANVAALAGNVEKKSIVENCGSEGIVFGSSNVGGLIGYLEISQMKGCYAAVEVYAKESNVGGLVGNISSKSKVMNCYATGNVEGGDYVGGLIGALKFF
jgi:hypothetical protein